MVNGTNGHKPSACSFILNGECEISVNGCTVATIGKAQNFGESALLNYGTRRKATVKALSFLWLSSLSKFDFDDVVSVYPGDGKVMLFNAREKLAKLENANIKAQAKNSLRNSDSPCEFPDGEICARTVSSICTHRFRTIRMKKLPAPPFRCRKPPMRSCGKLVPRRDPKISVKLSHPGFIRSMGTSLVAGICLQMVRTTSWRGI